MFQGNSSEVHSWVHVLQPAVKLQRPLGETNLIEIDGELPQSQHTVVIIDFSYCVLYDRMKSKGRQDLCLVVTSSVCSSASRSSTTFQSLPETFLLALNI